MRFLTFSMQITIQAGTRKTVINTLKTIRKNIDESLRYFCGGFVISDYGYPKSFFPQGQQNIFAIENRIASRAMLNLELARDYIRKKIKTIDENIFSIVVND
ncbi:hypothetical protein [Chryseobacterium balustinum]|uniref:hypothetical protein n=1 Tax=Chryseobacterium balustinum TaxID=246 RepID=UPI000F508D28|nr:hypothetical protein [Chryseobacterium balustinum]